MLRGIVAAAALLTMAGAALAEEPGFAVKPRATAAKEGVKIEFTATAATDCAVYVLDAKGQVVRHLAAGVLGPNAPEPLIVGAAPSGRPDVAGAHMGAPLRVSLVWDGKDDLGRIVSKMGTGTISEKSVGNGASPHFPGPFKFRVALGLRPALDGFLGRAPATLGDVRGLATGPDGTVYVLHTFFGFGMGSSQVHVSAFDRSGKYLRTILPYPADLPEEKLKGLKRLEVEKGIRVPFVYNGETRALLPGMGGERPMQRMAVTADGRIAMVGVHQILRMYKGFPQVMVIRTDGSVPEDPHRAILPPDRNGATGCLAVSPDGRTLYATGFGRGLDKRDSDDAVYRFGWNDKEITPFLGERRQPGSDDKHFNEPTSLAVDKSGNLYVSDKRNDRIAVFTPAGAFLGALKTEKPERVEVNAKTGAVYVLGGARVNELRKYASWKDAPPVATATLPFFKHRLYTAVMAVDTSAEPPVLWFGTHHGVWSIYGLLRIEDRGNAFGDQVDVARPFDSARMNAAKATDLAFFPSLDRVYLWPPRDEPRPARIFNTRTGAAVPMKFPRMSGSGNIAAAGRDGNLYVYWNYPTASIRRYSPDLKDLPFSGTANGFIDDLGSPRTRGRGLFADARGNVYVLQQAGDPVALAAVQDRYGDANVLSIYGPDGKPIKQAVVDSDIRSLNSACVDPSGNIYMAVGARPGDAMVPAWLKGQAPDGPKDPAADLGYNYYPLMYGSIVKFGPEGGTIHTKEPGTALAFGYTSKTALQGAKWLFFGASVVPSWRTKGTPDICLCDSPRMDVDGFGRTFFPDACAFRVGILDTNGNLITWLGTYGNPDSGAPGAAGSSIPLGWPAAVAAGDDLILIGDRLNERVARVRLTYAAEEACAAP